jgi:transcriptional regulator with XRE-family HTH domain
MSQQDFGKIAGVSDKAVSAWENGTRTPRMGAIEKIANHFGINKSEIIEDGYTNRIPLNREVIDNAIQRVISSIEYANSIPPDSRTSEIIKAVSKLNDDGKIRVLQYIHDISDMYRRKKS